MIHPTAIVSPDAVLGKNVIVGPFTMISGNVRIGENCRIGAYCELGHASPNANEQPLVIGAGAVIRSHSVFYEGSRFGSGLVTGHRVTVREGTNAGANLQIGTLSDIQGTCNFGDYVRLHSNVHIGKHSEIGNFVWIFPYVVLTNDPHPPSNVMQGVKVCDFASIATMCVVLPGVTIGEGALIGAHSSVTKDVAPGAVVVGVPGRYICQAEEVRLKDGSNEPAYPWRRHFRRGYPDEVTLRWAEEFSGISEGGQKE